MVKRTKDSLLSRSKTTKQVDGRGRPPKGIELKPKTFNLPVRIIEIIESESEHRGMSQSEFVSLALIDYLARENIKARPRRKSVAEIAKEKGIDL